MIKLEFGKALRQRRTQRKMTLEQAALEADVSMRFLQDLEAGNKMPSVRTVFRLARALGTTPSALLKPAWEVWLAEQ